MTRITAESIVGMAASLRLAEKSAEIAATAPALIASRSEEERVQEQERLVRRLNEISAVTEGLKVTGVAEARLANLIEIEGKIATELKALDGAVEQRLRLSAQRETAVADLAVVQTKFQNALEPLVDDAGFNLVTTSEEVTAKSKEAITGLVEGGVNALQALLTLRAEGNLVAGLLAEAAHVDDPALIQPIRERFSAAAAAIEQSLEALPQSPENERLREASKALIALGGGADNVFDVRSQELRAPAETRHSLQAKREEMAAAVEVAHRTLLETLDADGGRRRLRPRDHQRGRDRQEHEGDHRSGRRWGEHLAGAADAACRGQPGGGPAERGRRRPRPEFTASRSRSASSRPRAARRSCSRSFPPRSTTMRSRASRRS